MTTVVPADAGTGTGAASSGAVPAGRPRRRARGGRTAALKGFAFTVPFFAGFGLVFVAPLCYALQESLFTERMASDGLGGTSRVFVGLGNYVRVLADEAYWGSMGRVVVFAAVQIPLMLGLSLLAALLLDLCAGRRATFFRLGLLLPYMIPAIVATLVWLYIYSPRLGPVTDIAAWFGADVDMFSPGLLWVSIGNLLTWAGLGYNMLIIYGSLRSVPRELFEAARLDGAGELRIAWSVKIPSVRGALVLTGMLSIIHMLQIFAEPLVFRVTSPETVTAGFTPIMMIYNLAFTQGNYTYAAALSVVLALVVGAASALFYRIVNREAS